MLYINDEIEVTPKNMDLLDEEIKVFYRAEMEKIKRKEHIPNGDKDYVFIDPKPARFGNNGTQEPRQIIEIPLTATFKGLKWRWCQSVSIKAKGEKVFDPRVSILFRKAESLDPSKIEDREKIFFYLYISPKVRQRLRLENKEEEYKKSREKDALLLDVKWYINSDKSPLRSKNEETLKYIASAWYISDTETMTPEILKKNVLDKIMKEEKIKKEKGEGRGYEEFLYEIENLYEVKTRSSIQKAIESKQLILIDNAWKLEGKVICQLPVKYHLLPILGLEEHFQKFPDIAEQLIAKVSDSGEIVPEMNSSLQASDDIESLMKEYDPEFNLSNESGIIESVKKIKFQQKKSILKRLGIKSIPGENDQALTDKLIVKLKSFIPEDANY